jgi:hypothetical protein
MNRAIAIEEGNVTLAEFENAPGVVALSDFAMTTLLRSATHRGWQSLLARQLEAVGDLSRNWDSYDGASADAETIAGARSLLERIIGATQDIEKPHVRPTPAGGVQFDWESGGRYFEIEIAEPTLAHYFFEDRDARVEAEGTIQIGQSLNPIINYLRRLTAQRRE